MKKFIYIAIIILVGSMIYNLISMDFKLSVWGEENRPFIIGTGAGICGLILCFVMLQYYRLKSNLNQRSKSL